MMNGGHAATGALAGALTSPAVGAATGAQLGIAGTTVGALLGAGAALLPDLDADGATAYRSGGPVTKIVGESLQWLARLAYRATRMPHDRDSDGEHRGLIHTPAFAIVTGLLVGLGSHLTQWVTAAVIPLVLAPGIGALSRSGPTWIRHRLRTHRDTYAMLAALFITGVLVGTGTIAHLGWYAAVSITVGMIVHSAGDSATRSGIPWTWPLRRRCEHCSPVVRCPGSRWRRGHILPNRLRWSVGSKPGRAIESTIEAICIGLVLLLHMPAAITLVTHTS